jgi:hypothetical protein
LRALGDDDDDQGAGRRASSLRAAAYVLGVVERPCLLPNSHTPPPALGAPLRALGLDQGREVDQGAADAP